MSDPTADLTEALDAATLNADVGQSWCDYEDERRAVAEWLLASGLVSVNPLCSTCGGTGTETQVIPGYMGDPPEREDGPCPAGCVNGRTSVMARPSAQDLSEVLREILGPSLDVGEYIADELLESPLFRQVGGDR